MKHEEAVQLINRALILKKQPEIWLDLGCGTGTFSRALAACLPPGSHITGIDEAARHLVAPPDSGVDIRFLRADFTSLPAEVPSPDGILMANSIHYIQDKPELIRQLERRFREKPQFLFVEYDTLSANPWVPYPVSFVALKELFSKMGYATIEKTGEIKSRFGGKMYAAVIRQ